MKSHLNEPLLQQIATTTGGFYLPLRGANTMDTLYERGLAPLPKSEGEEKLVRRYHEQFHWPLAMAMLLLLAEMFFPERLKSTVHSPQSKVEVAALAVFITILWLPTVASASPSSALRDYQAGNFTNALTEFTMLAEVRTNDLRLVFNAGDAAYRATNFDLARSLFQQVTLSPDLKLQQKAFYNLGNAQYRMGEQKFEPDSDSLNAMEETWTEAAQSYAHAVQLNTNDVDAVFNWRFTKRQWSRSRS